MSDFEPRTQTFYLLAADGKTQIPVSLGYLNYYHFEDISKGVNFGAQVGACFMLLVVACCLMPSFKLLKISQWLQMCALVLNIIRQVLFAVFFTSNWNDTYAVFTSDYSHITPADVARNVATEVISIIIGILVQIILGFQAWAMVNLLTPRWKWSLAVFSALVSLVTVAFRFATGIINIQYMMGVSAMPGSLVMTHVTYTILQAASVFWYCVLFNSKLVVHLIKNRGVLPSRRGLSAIEVLVITNGLLMFAPALFSGLAFGKWMKLETGSLAQTSVIIVLILGTLIAQRVCGPEAATGQSGHSGSARSSAPFKYGSSSGSCPGERIPSTVTSHVSASRHRDAGTDSIEAELRQIDSTDIEKVGGVRVNQEFERREERT